MSKRFVVLFGLLLCCLVGFVPFVSAGSVTPSWTLLSSVGEWDSNDVTHLGVVAGNNESWSFLNYSSGVVSDFSGWGLNYSINDFSAVKRDFWYLQGWMDFAWAVRLVKNDGSYVGGMMYLKGVADVFNVSHVGQFWIGRYGQHYMGSLDADGRGVKGLGLRVFTNVTHVLFNYEYWSHVPTEVSASDIEVRDSWNETVAFDVYGEDINVQLFFGWAGSGSFDMTSVYDKITTAGEQVVSMSDSDVIVDPSNPFLSWNSFIAMLTNAFYNYAGFVPVVLAIGVPLIVIAPALFVLAVMQSGMDSIEVGGFQPLFNLAMKIWDTGAGRVLNWRWMELAGKNRLALCCSRKGKRATLIAKMLHSVNLLGDGAGGVGKAIKNFVSGEGL